MTYPNFGSERITRWKMLLQEYSINIVYNVVRRPDKLAAQFIFVISYLSDATSADPSLLDKHTALQTVTLGWTSSCDRSQFIRTVCLCEINGLLGQIELGQNADQVMSPTRAASTPKQSSRPWTTYANSSAILEWRLENRQRVVLEELYI